MIPHLKCMDFLVLRFMILRPSFSFLYSMSLMFVTLLFGGWVRVFLHNAPMDVGSCGGEFPMLVGGAWGVRSGWMFFREVPGSFDRPLPWLAGHSRSSISPMSSGNVLTVLLGGVPLFLRPFDSRWHSLHTYFWSALGLSSVERRP